MTFINDAQALHQAGLLDEYVKATRYGGLPDAVLYALVIAQANFDMTADERFAAAASLRSRTISTLPGAVLTDVTDVCESIRYERQDLTTALRESVERARAERNDA